MSQPNVIAGYVITLPSRAASQQNPAKIFGANPGIIRKT